MARFTESVVEESALTWLAGLEYATAYGPEIAPGEPGAERADYGQVVLVGRLRAALERLNPGLPADALEAAAKRLLRPEGATLIAQNRDVHGLLRLGVPVEYRRPDGSIAGDRVRVIDFDDPANNDWLAVNQFTVVEDRHERRPDVVLFLNGLPLAVIELKNAADEDADIWSAFNQLQTYKAEIPSLFAYNAALVISDGTEARIGSLSADRERFMPWRTIGGEATAEKKLAQLEVLLKGVFDRRRFLDLARDFLVFEDEGPGKVVKKMAGYHQFHAVQVAVAETLRATGAPTQRESREPWNVYGAGRRPDGKPGDRRVGVVWHTQGSGKSLTMVFYAGCIMRHPGMENPTIVVLTDRNDLDDQLFRTFGRCAEILGEDPVQAESRADLREKLRRASGGIVFTTIQKFLPEDGASADAKRLSDRRNIVVIADEAHRSQYGLKARLDTASGEIAYGLAKHLRDALPHASFIAFTGTPIEKADKNTRAVFGDYISIYDIMRAVEDKATVPIYYESRMARLELPEAEKPQLDADFDEITEQEEPDRRDRLRSKWAQLESVVGTERRVRLIADDLVRHFEGRLLGMSGKAMVVCMSRRICVELYRAIVALRPAWHSDDDERGAIKVVMTGRADDGPDWQGHTRNKARREKLADRFRDENDPLQIVLVRDMWLTGFDVPSCHTMYVDKPMHGHSLMQAIARVNRVWGEKPGGLVVDYLGLADQLKEALRAYAESGGRGEAKVDQEQAVIKLLEAHEVCAGLFAGFDWSAWHSTEPTARLSVLPAAQEHILSVPDGRQRYLDAVAELATAFALAVPDDRALALREDLAFFQAVRAVLVKGAGGSGRPEPDLDHAIRQLVSRAVASDEVIDLFAAAGLQRPELSILSDEFLAEVRGMPHKNLAVEVLRKLLLGEIKARSRKNAVQSKKFSEMLAESIRRYQARAIQTVAVIEELIALAKEMRAANARGEQLGLSEDELAFYDALETNDSAVKVLGDETLRTIARELVKAVRANLATDWTIRENVRAQMRIIVKRILRKYGYPPDKQAKATETVLEQAALVCKEEAA